MPRACFLFYILITVFNMIPFIPMSLKGISGIIFIMISIIKFRNRAGYITATLLIILGFINLSRGVLVDYEYGIVAMVMGSVLYYFIAYYLGTSTENLRQKNELLRTEIERREKTEKELNEKLFIIQSLLHTIPSPVFFKDLNFKFIGCNRAFEEAMGIREKELIGKTSWDIADSELADIYNEIDTDILESADDEVHETIIRFADGNLRNIILNEALFKDEEGKPKGIVGVMTDITDKKVSETLKLKVEEKGHMIDEILEQDKMKTEFFSNISHELRTPLNVILGSVQLVESYAKTENYDDNKGKVVKNIATMKQNCFRLLRLVNNLIDITKIDASAFELHLRNRNIVGIVEDITLSVATYAENKGIELIFDTELEEMTIACDDEKIERIMLNLLSNAIKFTPKGGCIFVKINNDNESLWIEVTDTGTGIPLNKQQEIFKRFYQVDDSFLKQQEGSGIGLNLVKALVEMHQGTINVKSEIKKGTTFTIKLPCTTIEEGGTETKILRKQDRIERIHVELSDIYLVS